MTKTAELEKALKVGLKGYGRLRGKKMTEIKIREQMGVYSYGK